MKKQNIAVLLSSFMLLTILVPSLVAAQGTPQEGELTLTGEIDLFFEGYDPDDPAVNPQQLTFKGQSTSSSDKTTSLNYTHGSWNEAQFIGVMDLDNTQSFTVTVEASEIFDAGGGKQFQTDAFGIATASDGFALGSVTITCAATKCSVPLTEAATGTLTENLYYYIPTGSGYTYADADVTAPLNVLSTSFDWDTGTYTDLLSGAQVLLSNTGPTAHEVVGYYGVGVNFKVNIPGATPAGTYTGTITYDLNIAPAP